MTFWDFANQHVVVVVLVAALIAVVAVSLIDALKVKWKNKENSHATNDSD